MEDINSYNERVFIAPKSNKTDVVKQIVDRMDVDNEDTVSLGNESVYSNARDFYANNTLDGDDWDKYGDGLPNKIFANLNHTVPIMEEMAEQPSSSSQRYSSNVVNTALCNKTVYTVDHVIKANEAKTSLLAEIEDDTWIIDSGASHHITTKLTDYTSYQPDQPLPSWRSRHELAKMEIHAIPVTSIFCTLDCDKVIDNLYEKFGMCTETNLAKTFAA